MCRMIGMVLSPVPGKIEEAGAKSAPASLPSWQHLVGATNSLREQALTGKAPLGEAPGHDDSWGIGWLDEDAQVSLLRQTGSAAESAFFVFASEAAARTQAGSGPAHALIAHLRKASCGAITSENAHPIRVEYRSGSGENGEGSGSKETLLIAHNGTLRKPLLEVLRGDLRAAHRIEAASDSDTVVLAGWLADKLSVSDADSVFDSLAQALTHLFQTADTLAEGDRTTVYTGVNLLITHSSGLYALRQFSREEEYYTLSARPLETSGDEAEGWIVASEATDDFLSWSPLTPGALTFYPSRGVSGAARTHQVAIN